MTCHHFVETQLFPLRTLCNFQNIKSDNIQRRPEQSTPF
jgi:hypothetical protein